MRHLCLSLLGLVLLLAPTTVQADRFDQTTQRIILGAKRIPQNLERRYDSFIDMSSEMAGAPKGGRALEARDPARFDPPSAFERKEKKEELAKPHYADAPIIKSGSARDVENYEPIQIIETPYASSGAPRYVSENVPAPVIYSNDPTSSSSALGVSAQQPTRNSDYEDHRFATKNRRQLTVQERSVIFSQRPTYAIITRQDAQ